MNTWGAPSSVKLLPTHLHLLEAVTSYSRISNRLIVKERLTELILVLVSALAQKSLGVCTEKYERNWRPSQGTDQLSYGHLLKSIWILAAGCDAAAKPNAPLVTLYQTIFRRVLDRAFDRGKGGFYELGRFDRPVRRGAKAWWVQAESLMCAMKMYLLTNEKTYWDCFSKTFEWIAGYQVDWKRGDWYWEIGIDATPLGDKAGEWKAAYHNGRAMIESVGHIENLLAKNLITANV